MTDWTMVLIALGGFASVCFLFWVVAKHPAADRTADILDGLREPIWKSEWKSGEKNDDNG